MTAEKPHGAILGKISVYTCSGLVVPLHVFAQAVMALHYASLF